MIYFLVLNVILAIVGLAAAAAAHDIGITIFGFGLFAFGVFFALFLVKRHFDHADGSARH